jgi:hypothetical protein
MRVTEALGFVAQRDGLYWLTAGGRELLSARGAAAPDRLSREQGKMVARQLLVHADAKKAAALVLAEFSKKTGYESWMAIAAVPRDRTSNLVCRLLQQACLMKHDGDYLVLDESDRAFLAELYEGEVALTQEELLKRLAMERRWGDAAEKYVLQVERERLASLGFPRLAEMVEHISPGNCGAGYDILSFEVDGTPRYIEVKSSQRQRLRYRWSLGHRATAERFRRQYWIYFVPMKEDEPRPKSAPILVQDPLSFIPATLDETPTAFLVDSKRLQGSHLKELRVGAQRLVLFCV